MSRVDRLSNYPYVRLKVRCLFGHCGRVGEYNLAVLAARYGAHAKLDEVVYMLAKDCPYSRPPGARIRKYQARCGACVDLPTDQAPDLAPTGGPA